MERVKRVERKKNFNKIQRKKYITNKYATMWRENVTSGKFTTLIEQLKCPKIFRRLCEKDLVKEETKKVKEMILKEILND